MKKVLSVLVAVVLTVALPVGALAAEPGAVLDMASAQEIVMVESLEIGVDDVLIQENDGVAIYYNARATSYKIIWESGTPTYYTRKAGAQYVNGSINNRHTATATSLNSFFKLSYIINGEDAYLYNGDYSSYTIQ